MSSVAGRPFVKMNGLGNDFVIVDLRGAGARLTPADARAIADRRAGVGCDQVITIEDRGGLFMGVFNADGSEVGACGNAARCVGAILMDEFDSDAVEFMTLPGPLRACRAAEGRVTVDMGEPKFGWRDIPLAEPFEDTRFIDIKLGPIDKPALWGPSAVSMGNPHCIFFVEDAEAQALDRFGPMIENHPLFPERTNVEVAEVRGEHLIRLRVWERGVGITKACGTGACAAVVAAHRRRQTARKATVLLDGGPLAIEWRDDNHVFMTGPVAFEFEGRLPERL
ncbi:MAG: diaminopimelate epimerase [Parvularculaceae bacterium]|nr:diaminopimelate epimerase [Parvularculaceae bacterium]